MRKEFDAIEFGIRAPIGVSVSLDDLGDFAVDEEGDDRLLFSDLGDMDI